MGRKKARFRCNGAGYSSPTAVDVTTLYLASRLLPFKQTSAIESPAISSRRPVDQASSSEKTDAKLPSEQRSSSASYLSIDSLPSE